MGTGHRDPFILYTVEITVPNGKRGCLRPREMGWPAQGPLAVLSYLCHMVSPLCSPLALEAIVDDYNNNSDIANTYCSLDTVLKNQ